MLLYRSTSLTAGGVITEVDNLIQDTSNDIWSATEKLYAVKQATRKLFPDIFVPETDTSLSTASNTFRYDIPGDLDVLLAVRILPDSNSAYEDIGFYTESTASGSTLILYDDFGSGYTLKLVGGKRLTIPTASGDSLDIPQDAEDLLILGVQIELYQTLLKDKAKLNQFSAREQEVTEVDVLSMLREMKREYKSRLGEVNSILLMQITRI